MQLGKPAPFAHRRPAALIADPHAAAARSAVSVSMLPNDGLNAVFEAAVQPTGEAIVNAMVGAETRTGIDGHKVTALPTTGSARH
ncbi:MAG TPA: P1 family peptidase [Bryobacteraceae bacterium]